MSFSLNITYNLEKVNDKIKIEEINTILYILEFEILILRLYYFVF